MELIAFAILNSCAGPSQSSEDQRRDIHPVDDEGMKNISMQHPRDKTKTPDSASAPNPTCTPTVVGFIQALLLFGKSDHPAPTTPSPIGIPTATVHAAAAKKLKPQLSMLKSAQRHQCRMTKTGCRKDAARMLQRCRRMQDAASRNREGAGESDSCDRTGMIASDTFGAAEATEAGLSCPKC